MQTIASFRDASEAHIVRGLLESEGMHPVIQDEFLIQNDWVYSQAIGGVKLQVPDEEFDLAREILARDPGEQSPSSEETPELCSDDICPKCGSCSTTGQQYSLWSLIPSLILQLPVFFKKRRRVCTECGEVWKVENRPNDGADEDQE
jgi:hypothetical protein